MFDAKIVPQKNGRKGLKETKKRIKIFANLSKAPEHILSRFGEFAILAKKFTELRWSGEVFFHLTKNGAECSTNELKVEEIDKDAFLSHAEVINAMFRSMADSGKTDYELALRISAKWK